MHIKMSRVFFILLFFSGLAQLYGQQSKVLILDKVGTKKRINYVVGDEIILKTYKDKSEIRDNITDIQDSLVIFSDYYIHVNDIEYVKTVHTEGFFSPSNGPKLIVAGVLLFTIDQLNSTLIQGNDFRLDKGVTIVSASLIAFGAFWTSLKVRKFKPGNNKRIRTFVL